ncbi:hypothetical protein T492DRAFT_984272, partial [Pavlovales sp. CCMP2436]
MEQGSRRRGMGLHLAAAALLLSGRANAAVSKVCLPYAENTGPAVIALAWGGGDPSNPIDDCVVTNAAGWRIAYALSGEAAVTVDVTGAATQTKVLSGLDSSTKYTVHVSALSSGGALIAGSQSSSVVITTDIAIVGEVKSFGFISTQQAVMQQLTFYENSFPYTFESFTEDDATENYLGTERFRITSGEGDALVNIVHFEQHGDVTFENTVAAAALQVAGSTLNVTAGLLSIGGDVLKVDTGAATVGFGALASVDAAAGTLQAVSATLGDVSTGALTVGGATIETSGESLTFKSGDSSSTTSLQLHWNPSLLGPAAGPWFDVENSKLHLDTLATSTAAGLDITGLKTLAFDSSLSDTAISDVKTISGVTSLETTSLNASDATVSTRLSVGNFITLDAVTGAVNAKTLSVGALGDALPGTLSIPGTLSFSNENSDSIALMHDFPGELLIAAGDYEMKVSFNGSLDATGAGIPIVDVPGNSIAVGSVKPSSALNTLTLTRVTSITTADSVQIADVSDESAFVEISPSLREVSNLRSIAFDASFSGAQSLILSDISISGKGAADGELRVGVNGATLFASSTLGTVSVGDIVLDSTTGTLSAGDIFLDGASGDLSATHIYSNSSVQARKRLAVDHSTDTNVPSATYMEHQFLAVSGHTDVVPGLLRVSQDGDAFIGLCADRANCAVPTVGVAGSELEITLGLGADFDSQTLTKSARFAADNITFYSNVHAETALIVPVIKSPALGLNVTVGADSENGGAELAINVGATDYALLATESKLIVNLNTQINGRLDLARELRVAGRVE